VVWKVAIDDDVEEVSPRTVSVRIYGANSEAIIERKAELETFTMLHSVGLGPALYGTFQNGLIVEFVEGRVVSEEDLREPTTSRAVATELARWHTSVHPEEHGIAPRHGGRYCFGQLAEWRRTAGSMLPSLFERKPEKEEQFRSYFGEDFTDYDAACAATEKAALALGSPIVFAHNDLVGGNILVSPDGNRVCFIDYEYASLNYRGFDLGDHFQEWTGLELVDGLYPSKEEQLVFLKAYLAATTADDADLGKLYREANHFALVSDLFWVSWALVQASVSSIDFDYMAYAGTRWRRYKTNRDEYLAASL
jgi:ethanolamine kinase